LHQSSLVNNIVKVNIYLKPKTNPMTRNSTSAMGALHPVLFFTLVYIISILMALFVCRAVYISVNGDPDVVQTEAKQDQHITLNTSSTIAQTAALR
jgi:hypothetical protein